jgi:DNA-binding PadR family transcriptional regulator
VRFLFLALLATGPVHGYDLKRAYDATFGAVWGPLNIGQVYTTMGRLERDRLVAHRTVTQGDRPDKKVYEITDAGRAALREWLTAADEAPAVKSDLVLKLVAARLTGADPAPIVARQRQRYLQALRDLDALASSFDGANGDRAAISARDDGGPRDDTAVHALLVEGAALHLDAELRWLDLCDRRLRAGRSRPDKGEG